MARERSGPPDTVAEMNVIASSEYDRALELAEAELTDLSATLDRGAPQDSMFVTSVLGLGIRARTLFLGFIRLVHSDVPIAALALMRPTIEINLTLRFLVKKPELHTELWVAEGERQAAILVREIEADPELLRMAGGEGLISEEWHEDKRGVVAAARAKAIEEGVAGVGVSGSVMPSIRSIAYDHGDAATREAYTLAYRSLSPAIHTTARSFQHGEFVPIDGGLVTYREFVDAGREVRRHRALNATTFASTLQILSGPLELGIDVKADTVKHILMSITTA